MTSTRRPRRASCSLAWIAVASLLPAVASAHSFAMPYNLPVPFTVYAFGAAAALVLSFVAVGVFMTVPSRVGTVDAGVSAACPQGATTASRVCGAIGLASLLLCIVTGLVGTRNAFANWNMTFFWIVFVLGVAYAVALVGDFYALFNPWKALVDLIGRSGLARFDGRIARPERLGRYPALALYMAFIWFELFGHAGPFGLSVALAVYTGINVVGAWLLGRDRWFRQGEFFAIFMDLLGRMSPRAVPWDPEAPRPRDGRTWRYPFVGMLDEPAESIGLVVFILFMLSSTAFDGLHETTPWARLFWADIYPWLGPLVPTTAARKYIVSAELYYAWQWWALIVSPFAYLAVYALFIRIVKAVARSRESLRALMLRFAMTLVPIAFVYHVTHYYTLLLSQGGQIVKLASDPFGFGWNLFGTATSTIDPLFVDADVIWHTQVALILLGHIASVCLAHFEALRAVRSSRRAAASQLPMLVLMVLFTTLGLWILSLPLGSGG